MRTLLIVTLLGACGTTSEPEVPAVYFEMFQGAHYDMQPFNDAWTAARSNPALGVAYTFPLLTTGLADSTEVRLIAGRSGNDPQYPSTTGDDVIIADERLLATTLVASDAAEFAPGTVVPADLLCGTTVIAVRAYEEGAAVLPAYRLLAATWMVAVTTPCD